MVLTPVDSPLTTPHCRLGWLLNILPTTVVGTEGAAAGAEHSAVELYFLQQDGSTFRCNLLHRPYFYLEASAAFSTGAFHDSKSCDGCSI